MWSVFQLLGRADNLSSFVMLGATEDASIEVELFLSEKNGKKETMTFKRVFSRKNNSSRWFINKRCVNVPISFSSIDLVVGPDDT